jgi:hypothetical protein
MFLGLSASAYLVALIGENLVKLAFTAGVAACSRYREWQNARQQKKWAIANLSQLSGREGAALRWIYDRGGRVRTNANYSEIDALNRLHILKSEDPSQYSHERIFVINPSITKRVAQEFGARDDRRAEGNPPWLYTRY